MSTTTSILDLPQDVLLRLFDSLSLVSERIHSPRNNALRAFVETNSHLYDLYRLEFISSIDQSSRFRPGQSRGDALRTAAELGRMLTRFPRVHSLDIQGCGWVRECLETLKRFCGTQRIAELEEFCAGAAPMRKMDVIPILRCCGHLREVRLLDSQLSGRLLEEDFLTELAAHRALQSGLRVLEISNSRLSDASGERLGLLKGLTRVQLGGCINLGARTFRALGQVTGLEELLLWGTRITDSQANDLLSGMEYLKRLNIEDCHELTPRVLPDLPPSLEVLEASGCLIFDSVSAAETHQLVRLRRLSATVVSGSCPIAARFVKTLRRTLVELELDGLGLSDEISSAIGELEQLRTLSVHGSRVGDRTALAAAGLMHLEVLCMSFTGITIEGWEGIANNAHIPPLRELRSRGVLWGSAENQRAHLVSRNLESRGVHLVTDTWEFLGYDP